jgi:RHS repeat-associated protein
VNGGVTTQSVYVGDLMEVRTVTGGPGTGNLVYYSASGKRIALMSTGTLSYLVGDHLGSTVETLNNAGAVTASQLYGPYGASRYANGSMVTDFGFTGQRADSTTGLDYYNARYYDPAPGQFISADTVKDGQNRFGYVRGNPTTYTDPSGRQVGGASMTGAYFGGGALAGLPGEVGRIIAGGIFVAELVTIAGLTYKLVSDNWVNDTPYTTTAISTTHVVDQWWNEGMSWSTTSTDVISVSITWYPPTALTPTDDPEVTQPTDATPGAEATDAVTTGGTPPNSCDDGDQGSGLDDAAQQRLNKYLNDKQYVSHEELPNGNWRFYGKSKPPKNPGRTVTNRYAKEVDPRTGERWGWQESFDANGNRIQVHPKDINGVTYPVPHMLFSDDGKLERCFW